jgi:uncharacterized protein (TIGR02186 family)
VRRAGSLGALLGVWAALASGPAAAQREPVLVAAVSQSRIEVRQGFTGARLLLYGAVVDPESGGRAGDYDIVVVLKGPTEAVRIREKDRIAGIWMNAGSSDFRSAPAFFAVASSRPVSETVDERTAAIYELGTDFIQLSPSGLIDPEEQARYAKGLVEMRQRQGLYQENPTGVSIAERILYQAHIDLPSNVTTGRYTAETFAVSRGRVLASATARIEVVKVGLEGQVVSAARRWSLVYGLVAIALSLGMGWLAGRLFARN